MKVLRGYFGVGLCMPRDPANVGCAMRACGCFGAAFLAYSGKRYKKHAADTQQAHRHMPMFHYGDAPEDILKLVPYDCVPVAVELVPGATALQDYQHPERAFYVFGPEDGSLSGAVMDQCRDRVVIPSAFCVNLGAAVNIVLYDRKAKNTANRTPYENGLRLVGATT